MRTHYTLVFLFSLAWSTIKADHFLGGTITTRCTGGNFHEVTLQLFRNCNGAALIPQSLRFSNACGVEFSQGNLLPVSVQDVSSLCPAELPNSSCNGGSLLGFDLTTYRTTVYLSPCTDWVISWNTCCRNTSLNVSGAPGLYIETTLNNPNGLCNEAPHFVDNSVPMVCVGQAVQFDASATDSNGDSLRYELISARFSSPLAMPVQYQPGFEGSAPYTGMVINPATGMITFTPDAVGGIVVVVKVTETGANGQVIGTVMRDMLFVATNCSNSPPTLESGTFTATSGSASMTGGHAVTACSYTAYCASITITDPNIGQELSITSTIGTAMPEATLSVTGTNPIVVEVCSEGTAPGTYTFSIVAHDNACPVIGSRTYAYTVTVVDGPNAGESASTSVCENGSSFSMFERLGGNPTEGGSWVDPNGNSTDGIFVPGLTLAGIHTYSITGEGCTASARLSVVTYAATEPDCLIAGVDSHQPSSQLALHPDAGDAHRYWVTAPSMHATVRIIAPDGRLIQTSRQVSTGSTPFVVDIPATHHGPALIQLDDNTSGNRYVLRAVVP